MDLIESYREDFKLIRKPWTGVWIGLLLLVLILVPWFCNAHFVYIMTLTFIYSIGIHGQNILIGYTGQISLGQAGFLAIGAFIFAHLSGAGVPVIISLIVAGLLTGLVGVIVGFPSLRLKGPYLAIATLGFGIAVYQIFTSYEVLSGGRMGLTVPKLSPFFGLTTETSMYYFTFLLSLCFTLAFYNLVSSYMGRAFIAIRDNDIAAEVLGVNLTHYKLLSFGISSFYTGIHGGLYGMLLGFLDPPMFNFLESITLLVAVIIGGLAFVEGSIFGAAFVILIPQLLRDYKELVPTVFGFVIIMILIFEPHGFAGMWLKVRLYFRNWPFR